MILKAVMTITLTPHQVAWLEEQVRSGAFTSVQDGVREAVARMMPPDLDDLEWVRPYLDEARASVARGEVVTHQQFKTEMAAHIERLGRTK
jgi:Arc/MetJ-type ribon-helix-helix transcriptional regulator